MALRCQPVPSRPRAGRVPGGDLLNRPDQAVELFRLAPPIHVVDVRIDDGLRVRVRPAVGIDEGGTDAHQPDALLDLGHGAWPRETAPSQLGDLRLLALEIIQQAPEPGPD